MPSILSNDPQPPKSSPVSAVRNIVDQIMRSSNPQAAFQQMLDSSPDCKNEENLLGILTMLTLRQPFRGSYPITLDYGETWGNTYTKDNPHRGIDYGCPEGTEILASADGMVLNVGFAQTGYGNYVIIQHEDGFGTVYAHLKAWKGGIYRQVKKGEVIGWSGSTGNSTGPHLHFELRSKASDYRTAQDPKPFMQSVLDAEPISSTPTPVKPEFEPVESGFCVVVCDYANVRCHCDMNRIIGQRRKGDIIAIGDEVTMFNGLPYRDYYDAEKQCWLRIAEHDPDTQIIKNYDGLK